VISAGGAVVKDSDTGAVQFMHAMPSADVAEVTRDGRARGFALQHYRPAGIHVETQTRWIAYDQTRNSEPHRRVDDLLAAGERDGLPTDVVKMIWLGDPDAISAAVDEAHACYDGQLTVTRTDPPYLEFFAPNINKATALAEVAAGLGVTRAQVVAFGDGNNDVPMLAWAGVGVAMPHAHVAARAAANQVAPDGDPETALARAVAMVLADDGRDGHG